MKPGLITVALALLADAAAKYLSHLFLQNKEYSLKPFLTLRMVQNDGLAFAVFSGSKLPYVLPPVMIAVTMLILSRLKIDRMGYIAIGLILAGFLGNWLERLIFGSVTDMILFSFLPFFICNPADIFIFAGVILLSVSVIRNNRETS